MKRRFLSNRKNEFLGKLSGYPNAAVFEFLSRKITLVLLLLLLVGFNFLLAHFYPKEHALDLKFAYASDEAYESLSRLGPIQRDDYLLSILVLDMPYLIAYSSFLSGISFRIWKLRRVCVPVLLTLSADFFENLSVIQMLNHYPQKLSHWVLFASFCTTSKWVFVGMTFLVIGLGGFRKYFLKERFLGQLGN
jgi:hypothetical protein